MRTHPQIGLQYLTNRSDLGEERAKALDNLFYAYGTQTISTNRVDFASLYVTGRCHLKCPHCYAEEDFVGLAGDASSEQMVKIINFLAAVTDRIQLTGGEIFSRVDPLSKRNDTLLLVDEISRRGRETIMQTTGMHVTGPMLDYCSERLVKWFSLSLDGPDAESNTLLRGKDSAFIKTVALIPELKRRGFKVKVGTTITALTADRANLLRIGSLMESLQVDNWKITQFFGREVGRASGTNSKWLSVSNSVYEELVEDLVRRFAGREMRVTTHSAADFSKGPALLVQPTGIITVTRGTQDLNVGNALTDDPREMVIRLEALSGLVTIGANAQKTY